MKKLFVTALAAAFVASASVQALPVGNPSEASSLIDGIFWEGAAGDPCDPCATWCDSVSLRAGFYGDYVFNRMLETNVNKTTTIPDVYAANAVGTAGKQYPNAAFGQDLLESEFFTNAGYLALNLWDRFDLFGTLGSSEGRIKGTSATFNLAGTHDVFTAGTTLVSDAINNGSVEIFTSSDFSWSVGARGSLWECGCATLGAEFQYAKGEPTVKELSVLSNGADFYVKNPMGYAASELDDGILPAPTVAPTKKAKVKYDEWQAGLGFSYRINALTPYVAVKWSRANFKMDGLIVPQPTKDVPLNPLLPTTVAVAPDATKDAFQGVFVKLNNLKSSKSCGVAFGATLIDADKIAITAEARLIDERAVHINGQFRF